MKRGLKNPLKRVLNLLLYLSFCGLVGTGALLYWRLVPGSRGGRGLTFYEMSRHEWGDVHFWLAVVCMVALILHLLLQWKWLQKIAAGSRQWLLWLGLCAGLAVVVLFVTLPIERNGRFAHEEDHEEAAAEVQEREKGTGKGRKKNRKKEKKQQVKSREPGPPEGRGPGKGDGRGPRWLRE